MKNPLSGQAPKLIIIGDNFIASNLFNNFKRFSYFRASYYKTVSELKHGYDVYLDVSFNEKSQVEVIDEAIKNNAGKVLILNHWKVNFNYNQIPIIQIILPDVYSMDHPAFNKQGNGNCDDPEISYGNLISEAIRKIHESKVQKVPLTYFLYGSENIKYIFIENIYQPVQYAINEINKSKFLEIYDEERNTGIVLNEIKEIIDYDGEIILENTESIYNKPIEKLKVKYKCDSFTYNLKRIYNFLLISNERFIVY